jgi:manganese transport protein
LPNNDESTLTTSRRPTAGAHDRTALVHPLDDVLPGEARVLEAAEESLAGRRRGFRGTMPFLGPAFIAAVAYVDPGNFATNMAAGARYGYLLLWVVLMANLMAMLIQSMSAKLGIATGKNLPEVCRERYSRKTSVLLWLQAEVIAMATDLAEFMGAAIGLQLLFGIPLFPAALLTGVAAFGILALQAKGFRRLEAVIACLIGVIVLAFALQVFMAQPDTSGIAHGLFVPGFQGTESVLLAVGILGATVMPHVIYLHSALTQDRIVPESTEDARTLLRYTRIDVLVAMSIAGVINMSMLIMAAATFFKTGQQNVDSLEGAHETLEPILGGASATLFALALLASGLSSSAVGTLSGQVVMQGFVRRRIPLWVRRGATMVPAFVVIGLGLDPSRTLVISQVVLSFGIPFALVPLVWFTARADVMGALKNRPVTTAAAAVVAGLIICLNVFLLAQTFGLA